jgi:uncharacterized damage-inducible protein DinB
MKTITAEFYAAAPAFCNGPTHSLAAEWDRPRLRHGSNREAAPRPGVSYFDECNAKEACFPMTTIDADVTTLFLDFSRRKLLEQDWPRLLDCVESLTESQVWWRPNPASNSIGNLMLHLNGNMRQWLVASFNKQEDNRDRPAEFDAPELLSAAALLEKLGATLQEASKVLSRLTAADLLAEYDIQGYHVTGLYAVYQVVEHFAMHYGQILYITKNLGGKDLEFHRELNKTGRA